MGTKGQKRRRPKTVDISESHIVISELDENSASETASIQQKKNLCILIDGDPLKTPKGSIVAEPDEHLLREIVAELEYEDKLDVRRISLYNLYCTQKDFLEDDAFSPSDEEIDECLWMPVQEYLEHEDVSVFNKRVVAAAIGSSGLAPTVIEGYGTSETHEILVPAHMDRRTEWQS